MSNDFDPRAEREHQADLTKVAETRLAQPYEPRKHQRAALLALGLLVVVAVAFLSLVPFSTDMRRVVGHVSCTSAAIEATRGRVLAGSYLSPVGEQQARSAGDAVAPVLIDDLPGPLRPIALSPSPHAGDDTLRFAHVTVFDYGPCTHAGRRRLVASALVAVVGALVALVSRRYLTSTRYAA
jgi:hypothetical protein